MHNIFTQNRSVHSEIVLQLSIKAQILISDFLDYGLIEEAKELKEIDRNLTFLLHKAKGFDFVGEIADGGTLLVGEGNFSFSYSLTKKKRINPSNLTATTFEKERELSEQAVKNIENLKTLDVLVLSNVNAMTLSKTFGTMSFDNIIFQFPHVGSREPIEGHNPNFILVRNFLKSAKHHLKRGGKVLISAVDNPHYHGAFQFDEAAEKAGFEPPAMYPFDPSSFPGYTHTMTNEEESAIDDHKKFGTWVFRI
jgi:tRNA G46 methylase TrmB